MFRSGFLSSHGRQFGPTCPAPASHSTESILAIDLVEIVDAQLDSGLSCFPADARLRDLPTAGLPVNKFLTH